MNTTAEEVCGWMIGGGEKKWNEVQGKVKLKKEAWKKFVSIYRKTDMSIF